MTRKIIAGLAAVLLLAMCAGCENNKDNPAVLPDAVGQYAQAVDGGDYVTMTYIVSNDNNASPPNYYTSDQESIREIWRLARYGDWQYIGGARNSYSPCVILRIDPSMTYLYFSKDETLLVKTNAYSSLFKVPKGTYKNLSRYLDALVELRRDFDLSVLDPLLGAKTLDVAYRDSSAYSGGVKDFGNLGKMLQPDKWEYVEREFTDPLSAPESGPIRISSPEADWYLVLGAYKLADESDLYIASVWRGGDYYSYRIPEKQYTAVQDLVDKLL